MYVHMLTIQPIMTKAKTARFTLQRLYVNIFF